jgi:hypothetical protein
MSNKLGFHASMAAVILLLLLTACSGGSNPVSGNFGPGGNLTGQSTVTVENNRMVWGYYHCTIDPATGATEVIPDRGLMMHVNAVEWMQPPGGSTTNLQILNMNTTNWLTQGILTMDIGLKHPFTGLNQFTGFDVMGVFITDGHKNLLSQPGVTYTDGGVVDGTMLNPDGFTRWWNTDEFNDSTIRIFSHLTGKLAISPLGLNAKLNPYKYFTDNLSETADEAAWLGSHVAERGKFGAGVTNLRRYELQWPIVGGSPLIKYDYAVVANWVAPSPNPPVNIPGDFPYSANALEPVALAVTDNSTLFCTTTTAGGDLSLDLRVYDWAYLKPGQSIDDTITRVIIEPISSTLPMPPLGYYDQTPGTWDVEAGGTNSSVWHVDIPSLMPTSSADIELFVILETIFNYDNGFGTTYPTGSPLCSYFTCKVDVKPYDPGTDLPPACETPVSALGWTTRTALELEEFTANVGDPTGDPVNIDWSVTSVGYPDIWVTTDSSTNTVDWWDVTEQGTWTGNFEVAVSVYNGEGFAGCSTIVTVSPPPTIEPVTGQGDILLTPQPDQGAEDPDITVWNTGSGSHGIIMVEDPTDPDVNEHVRMVQFDDSYSSYDQYRLLPNTPVTQLNDPSFFNDYHKFDVRLNGQTYSLTSSNDVTHRLTYPSDPINLNDPTHSFIMTYYKSPVPDNDILLWPDGDAGIPPNADPDAISWKHVVDWTSGAVSLDQRMYGLMTLSEQWLVAHPVHTGFMWLIRHKPPYTPFDTTSETHGLVLSSQGPAGSHGDIDDTDPGSMALAVDDNMPYSINWSFSPGTDLTSDVVVWYIISGESTDTLRKVHIVLLPEAEFDDTGFADVNWQVDSWIGAGSLKWMDFGGATPVDVAVLNSNKTSGGLDHKYNWLAVLLYTGTTWQVNVYDYRFVPNPADRTLLLVGSYSGADGRVPTALDVDTVDNEIHVLHHDVGGGDHRVSVLHFVP